MDHHDARQQQGHRAQENVEDRSPQRFALGKARPHDKGNGQDARRTRRLRRWRGSIATGSGPGTAVKLGPAATATCAPQVAPHLWGSAVLFAAGLHLAIATPCVTTVEFSRGHNPLQGDLVEESFDLEDGYVLAPTRPGLGLTLRRDFVERITVPS